MLPRKMRTVLLSVLLGSLVVLALVSVLHGATMRQTRITNGEEIQPGQYPFLSAVVSGRDASLTVGTQNARALYFGAGLQQSFSGRLADCDVSAPHSS